MLLRPLTIQHPERLVILRWDGRFIGGSTRGFKDAFSLPMYKDLNDNKPAGVAGLAARWQEIVVIGLDSVVDRSVAEMVSGNYFDVLGVRSVLGRTLTTEDEAKPEASLFLVLNYDYWKRQFGGDPSVL